MYNFLIKQLEAYEYHFILCTIGHGDVTFTHDDFWFGLQIRIRMVLTQLRQPDRYSFGNISNAVDWSHFQMKQTSYFLFIWCSKHSSWPFVRIPLCSYCTSQAVCDQRRSPTQDEWEERILHSKHLEHIGLVTSSLRWEIPGTRDHLTG